MFGARPAAWRPPARQLSGGRGPPAMLERRSRARRTKRELARLGRRRVGALFGGWAEWGGRKAGLAEIDGRARRRSWTGAAAAAYSSCCRCC
ncbi:hypothetical protein ZWY2020_022554 [Hordeum vulgare]|nr:hypothetical protein ZWY2020_022554 [Hordeum vulgare]